MPPGYIWLSRDVACLTHRRRKQGAGGMQSPAQHDQRHFTTQVDKLVLEFPVTSVTAERSFCCLLPIKTLLHEVTHAAALNNFFLLYIYTAQTDDLDLLSVAKVCVCKHSPIQLFWEV